MVNSMTGFASLSSQADGTSWDWDIRSVNGRGLDLRLRLPEGCESIEQELRASLSKALSRGTVTVTLRHRASNAGIPELPNDEVLKPLIAELKTLQERAKDAGLEMKKASVAEVLNLIATIGPKPDATKWVSKAKSEISQLTQELKAARAQEGAALKTVLSQQLSNIQALLDAANELVPQRDQQNREKLIERVQAILEDQELDPNRLEHEIALMVVKSDITEELDRLAAHIVSAKDLLDASGPIGRKFDFLMQEFNREANTICSKSGHKELTKLGLDLKTTIDQMREQVQNIE